MSKIDLQSSILKTLKDDSIDHLVCVKFDGGGKESEVLELTYSDVKFLIKQLCTLVLRQLYKIKELDINAYLCHFPVVQPN